MSKLYDVVGISIDLGFGDGGGFTVITRIGINIPFEGPLQHTENYVRKYRVPVGDEQYALPSERVDGLMAAISIDLWDALTKYKLYLQRCRMASASLIGWLIWRRSDIPAIPTMIANPIRGTGSNNVCTSGCYDYEAITRLVVRHDASDDCIVSG